MNKTRAVRLGDICQVVSGATPKTSADEYWGGDINWVTPADLSKINGAYISETPRKITEAGLKSCATSLLPRNSVLLSSRAPIGHVAINTVPMATNQGFKSLIPGDKVLPKFLYYWLRDNKDYLQSLGVGATFKELSKKTVENIKLDLPDLVEQANQVEIRDLQTLIAQKRERQQELFIELERARFIEEFGNPITNPKNLPTARLSDIATISTGNSPSRSDKENFGDYIEWIKSNNLGKKYPTEAAEYLSEKGAKKARIAPAGSILVTCIAGSPTSIGKCSITDRDVAFNQQINSITPHNTKDLEFIWRQIQLFPELVQMKSTGGMKGLVSKTEFSKILILK